MREAHVVNASPLIFLGNAGYLDLLRHAGSSRIVVPEPVFREVTASGHADVAAASIAKASWIERVAAQATPPGVASWDLGLGETSVVATALGMEATAVLDDLAARRCALAAGVRVMGTLGIVVAAHRRGYVDDPRAVILELGAHGMWLSDTVIEKAMALLKRGTRDAGGDR